MNAWKLCSLILGSFTLAVLLSLSSTDRSQHNNQLVGTPAQTQRVDGGGPVPPVQLRSLMADGAGPVPPRPPKRALSLMADGAGPVPPRPPKRALNLMADGAGPVPPRPPKSINAGFLAA